VNGVAVSIHLTDHTVTLQNGSKLSITDLSVGDTIEITEIISSQNCVKGKLIRGKNSKPITSTNATTSQTTSTPTKPATTTNTQTERSDNKPRAPSTVRTSLPEDTRKNGWLSVRPVSEIDNKSRDRTFTAARPKDQGTVETSRSFFSTKSVSNIHGLASSVSPALKKETIRVWFKDGSFKTVAIIQDTTCEEVIERITKRIPSIGVHQNAATHFVLSEVAPDGATRVLKAKDKPAAVQASWKDKTVYKFVLGLHPRTIRRLSVQIKNGQDITEVFNETPRSKTDSFMDESDDGLDVLLKSLKEHAQRKQEEKKAQQSAWVRTSATDRTSSRLLLGRGTESPDSNGIQPDGSSPSDASPAAQAEQDVDEPDNEVDDFTETLHSPVDWFENEITSLSELVQSLPDNVLQNIQ